jgi:hypothetical protein
VIERAGVVTFGRNLVGRELSLALTSVHHRAHGMPSENSDKNGGQGDGHRHRTGKACLFAKTELQQNAGGQSEG